MVSRIDIGPDGGPYVAINENSNDLELQDINGNVIAVWDETEGQWDLNNNSLTNINAIDASSATLSETRTESSVTVTGEQDPTNTVLYGRDHGSDPATESVAVGVGARPNSDDGSGGSI
ncbi:MAG TPA: hypothetical protein VKP88_03680, partial [Candidatus Paceibacterota bacterium]|nr:hypothetical protein [Candidatus Paceibacterota bacterium]